MLQTERFEDKQQALIEVLTGWQATIWTALIGYVQSVDLVKQTCVVQPVMRGVKRKSDGTISAVLLPTLLDVPIAWPSGGGYTLTFPVAAGDEGLLVFSSRCMDPWWQSGGVQDQIDLRMHDLSDAVLVVGVRSQPRKLTSVSTTSTQLRKDDGSSYVDLAEHQITLHADANNYTQVQDATGGGVTKVRASTNIDLNGFVIDTTGNAVTPGEVTAKNTHTVSAHTHTVPNDSHGDAIGPTNTPTG